MINNRQDQNPAPTPLDETISQLRARLEAASEWPATANPLLDLVGSPVPAMDISEVDEEMLSLVVDDALKGVDIQKQYPQYFQRLLKEPALRDAFLEVMDLAQDEDPSPFRETTSLEKMPFIPVPPPRPVIQRSPAGWRATWNQSIAQLNAIFLSSGAEAVFRGAVDLEDPWFILLRDQVDLDGAQLQVFLEAAQEGEKPDELQLALAVVVNTQPLDQWPPLLASLHWGNYAETVSISSDGRAAFPAASFHQILNETGASFLADLALTLESAK